MVPLAITVAMVHCQQCCPQADPEGSPSLPSLCSPSLAYQPGASLAQASQPQLDHLVWHRAKHAGKGSTASSGGWGSFCPSRPLSFVWARRAPWSVSSPAPLLPLRLLSRASSLKKFQLHLSFRIQRHSAIDLVTGTSTALEGTLSQMGTATQRKRAPCVLLGPGQTAGVDSTTVTSNF